MDPEMAFTGIITDYFLFLGLFGCKDTDTLIDTYPGKDLAIIVRQYPLFV